MSTVAIITRTKNRPVLLQRAISSVLAQIHQDWIHVIVNDGGEASAVARLVDARKDEYRGRCKVIHNPGSVGMEAASNIGIRASESEFIAIHDDDDSWHPSFLTETLKAISCRISPLIKGVVTHSIQVIEELKSDKVSEIDRADYNSWLRVIELPRMVSGNTFPPISFIFERQVLREIGYFNETLPVLGDWEFNIRFLRKFDMLVLAKPLANYHHRASLRDTQSAYSNTVIAATNTHEFYRAQIINSWAREALEKGQLSMIQLHLLSQTLDRAAAAENNSWQVRRRLRRRGLEKYWHKMKRALRADK